MTVSGAPLDTAGIYMLEVLADGHEGALKSLQDWRVRSISAPVWQQALLSTSLRGEELARAYDRCGGDPDIFSRYILEEMRSGRI